MEIGHREAATLAIACLATSGVIIRPWRVPEGFWAMLGALALVLLNLTSWHQALAAAAKGTDVYLFLVGMMLAAEIAREEGFFDWIAAHAARSAGGSPRRLFALVFAVGTVVTALLSNDATAVVLTPAVYAAAKAAKAQPLPYLYICAFIANAASFVLPISNPANLVVFRDAMPPLVEWLQRFTLPSILAIAATYVALYATQYRLLAGRLDSDVPTPVPTRGCRIVGLGLVAMAAVLIVVSAAGMTLGVPTLACGLLLLASVATANAKMPWRTLGSIAWGVLPLVAGLFVLVEAVQATGLLTTMQRTLQMHGSNMTAATAVLAGLVVALACNLMNNLPVGLLAGATISATHAPPVLASAMLIGVDLGPNLSVTGSLATILWLAAMRREGVHVGAAQFLKVGTIVTLPALVLALLTAR